MGGRSLTLSGGRGIYSRPLTKGTAEVIIHVSAGKDPPHYLNERTIMARIDGPAIISNATLRTRDLAPAFLDALYLLGDDAAHTADKIRSEFHDVFVEIQELRGSLVGDVETIEATWLFDELHGALNKHAPDGTYFGASEGDGACFGFWEFEEDA